MSSIEIFFYVIPLLAFVLLTVNIILASHNPYQSKDSPFECGFVSFSHQNRSEFNISFFVFGLLFLLFDLEILLTYPYALSSYNIALFGLVIMIIFVLILTVGLGFEIGKNALVIKSKNVESK